MGCSIPGCNVGYSSTRNNNKRRAIRNKSTFAVPKNNEQLFQKWRSAVQTHTGKTLSLECRVCENHFLDEEVVRFDDIVMPDGAICQIERLRPRLKIGAVPSVFTPLPIDQSLESEEIQDEQQNNESLDFHKLINEIQTINMPNSTWSSTFLPEAREIIFLKWNPINYSIDKKLVVTESLTLKIIHYDRQITTDIIRKNVCTRQDLVEALQLLEKLKSCPGVQIKGQAMRSELCTSYLPNEPLSAKPSLRSRCNYCQKYRKNHSDKLRRKVLDVWKKRHERTKGVVKCVKRKNLRLQRKVLNLKAEIESSKQKCAAAAEDAVESAIVSLPEPQQQAVKACFAASKVKSSRGRRYEISWVYECLLLRIKSRKLYEHLRAHQILALPCADTLNKYIRRMNGCYGFQQVTFDLLKKKSVALNPEERRGTLLIDEMKLTEKLSFNRRTLTVNGFTDLGDHTPVHQQSQKGDHALVMIFQPFRGSWIQSLAAFLSRGCATSKVLHHLIMECIILLEKAGFHVDVVTTDGATWNRSMWKLFGISEENISCEHIFDESRRLWFCSDFPHLIKTLRNFVTKKCTTWTPNGDVHLKHWDAVIAKDNPLGFNLKVCPKLSEGDVRPKGYQKMNVARAYRFFGKQTGVGMLVYQADHEDLVACAPSVNLINNVHELIVAMSSRTPAQALRKNGDAITVLHISSQIEWCHFASDTFLLRSKSQNRSFLTHNILTQHIRSFLEFLNKWEVGATENDFLFMPQSTCYGLKITLRATIEIYEYLAANYNYDYLMTAKLNQDSLERFFGMMRGACGSNDHPDSNVFAQLFRLISTYSLVKPPRGSNIAGDEMLSTLLHSQDLTDSNERLTKFQSHLDVMIDNGAAAEEIAVIAAAATDHDYHVARSSDFVTSYISGYVARRSCRFTQCSACLDALKSQHSLPRDKMIDIASKGSLLRPSEMLFQLVSLMEAAVLKVVSGEQLHANSLFLIAEEIENQHGIPLVGCLQHRDTLTEAIIRFYLITRMHFLCNFANKIDNSKSEKARQYRKSAKLL